MSRFGSGENPLLAESAGVWDELMEAIGPASLLVVIETRLGTALKRRYSAEDVFQEAVMHAWRDRAKCEWRGVRAFRSWMLTIIDNRIRDLADREGAQKRGGGRAEIAVSQLGRPGADGGPPPLPMGMVTTTPSKVAIFREQAAAMRAALEGLEDDVREVVRLRLFEQMGVEEIAEELGLGVGAVRHRFRRGAEAYHQRLLRTLAGSSTQERIKKDATGGVPDSSPED